MNRYTTITLIGIIIIVVVIAALLVAGVSVPEPKEPGGLVPNIITYMEEVK